MCKMATTLLKIEQILNTKLEIRNSKQSQTTQFQMFQTRKFRAFENSNLFRISIFEIRVFRVQTLFGSGYAGLGGKR
ncbi:MAG: hypothetical protein A2170_16290 [Deltaproteobacteria bacterium RBG_13_53_10]|nr:MAG: hypothetical protein A2170_16290 [Deltaproteobacteria bacterium RBG_13_53_10]